MDAETAADEPSALVTESSPYPQWLDLIWRDPRLEHDLSLLILVDGVPAGLTEMISDGRGRLLSSMTGTLRAYRGRGLAKYAKTVALHMAREQGHTVAYTGNDTTNGPMLAINAWLGYRHCEELGLYAREI